MRKPFNSLTKKDVEYLRNMPAGIPMGKSGINYSFSPADIKAAIRHLETMYKGKIYQTFAEKIMIRNEIYECPRSNE